MSINAVSIKFNFACFSSTLSEEMGKLAYFSNQKSSSVTTHSEMDSGNENEPQTFRLQIFVQLSFATNAQSRKFRQCLDRRTLFDELMQWWSTPWYLRQQLSSNSLASSYSPNCCQLHTALVESAKAKKERKKGLWFDQNGVGQRQSYDGKERWRRVKDEAYVEKQRRQNLRPKSDCSSRSVSLARAPHSIQSATLRG